MSRKKTCRRKKTLRDLRHLTARAFGQLGDRFLALDQRVHAYKGRTVNDPEAHDLVIHAVDSQAITPTQIPDVLDQWRHPAHETFRTRSLWSLFNALTEVHKTGNPHTSLRRGEALHGLFDAAADLALVA